MSFFWELLIAQPTQGLIIIPCADYTSSFSPLSPRLPLSYSPLFKHFISLLSLGQKNAKKRGESVQPFLLLDMGKAWWGWGLELFGEGNCVRLSVGLQLPLSWGTWEIAHTEGQKGLRKSHSLSTDARVVMAKTSSGSITEEMQICIGKYVAGVNVVR